MNKIFDVALAVLTCILNFFRGRAISIKATCCIGGDNIEIYEPSK